MTYFAALALIVVLLIRPQEIWPFLSVLHLLDVLTVLVVLGLIVDTATGKQKPLYSPQLPFLGMFVAACFLMTGANLGVSRGLDIGTRTVFFPAIFMAAVMYGIQTLDRLKGAMRLLLVLGAFVSAVAVHQGQSPRECMQRVVDENGYRSIDLDTADGRPCGVPNDCRDGVRFDVDWACERIGLFRTLTTGGRVRWRGQLDDPNELSVFIGAIIPILFAVGFPKRDVGGDAGGRTVAGTMALIALSLGIYAVVLSQSRGGQLVVAIVFTIYFVSRLRWKGVVLGVLFALPVILLGGRSAAEADESANERRELLYEGVSLFLRNPIKGVGVDQFPDRVDSPLHLTAHNSYLLAAAEVGFFGLVIWSLLLWTSCKIPLMILRRPSDPKDAELRSIAMALLVSFAGIVVGIFFLSFTYKQLLFVWFGLAGAMYRVMKRRDETFEVRLGWRDWLGVVAVDISVLVALYAYTRLNPPGSS